MIKNVFFLYFSSPQSHICIKNVESILFALLDQKDDNILLLLEWKPKANKKPKENHYNDKQTIQTETF